MCRFCSRPSEGSAWPSSPPSRGPWTPSPKRTSAQLREAVEAIGGRYSRLPSHPYEQQMLILEVDLTGLRASKRAELSTKGYFSGSPNATGRQLVRAICPDYGEVIFCKLHRGQHHLLRGPKRDHRRGRARPWELPRAEKQDAHSPRRGLWHRREHRVALLLGLPVRREGLRGREGQKAGQERARGGLARRAHRRAIPWLSPLERRRPATRAPPRRC